MLVTLITRNWKQVWRNFLVADLQYYSMKRPKIENLEKPKIKVKRNTFEIISIQKYKIHNFKGFLEIKSIRETL
jgi:hypothetical protein